MSGSFTVAGAQSMAPATSVSTPGRGRAALMGTIGGHLEDGLLLLLAVFAFPLGILLIGTPIVLCARLILEILRRL